MIDYKLWKQNLISSIKDLSDKEFQENVWLGKSNEYCSSFIEDVSMLFATYGFEEEFWKDECIKKFNLIGEILIELKLLKDLLKSYLVKWKEKQVSDAEILKDPNWNKIVDQAKAVINLWNTQTEIV